MQTTTQTLRTLRAKFPGNCRTCNTRFAVDTLITWAPGDGARHADRAACEAARRLAVPPVETLREARAIFDFLKAAEGRGLKTPQARFLAPNGKDAMRLYLAGETSKTPGVLQILIADQWIGRIAPDGTLSGPRVTTEVAVALQRIADAPAIAAKQYAALTSRCSFCNLELTDAGSVLVGYGPICAERYGLPHTALGTPKAKTADDVYALPVDDDAPADAARDAADAFVDGLDPLPF